MSNQFAVREILVKVGSFVLSVWVVGLFCLLLAVMWHHNHWPEEHFVSPALSHLAVALIVGALLMTIEKAVFFEELRADVVRLLGRNALLHEVGLRDVARQDDRSYSGYADLIRGGKRLSVVVNYNHDWVGAWRPPLVDFLRDPDAVLEWFLIDPDSEFVAVLATKQKAQIEDIQKKIIAAESALQTLYAEHGGQGVVRVFRLAFPVFPTASVYLSEGRAGPGRVVFTLYTAASVKAPVPLFVFDEVPGDASSVFEFFRKDVARLRMNALLHFTLGPKVD